MNTVQVRSQLDSCNAQIAQYQNQARQYQSLLSEALSRQGYLQQQLAKARVVQDRCEGLRQPFARYDDAANAYGMALGAAMGCQNEVMNAFGRIRGDDYGQIQNIIREADALVERLSQELATVAAQADQYRQQAAAAQNNAQRSANNARALRSQLYA